MKNLVLAVIISLVMVATASAQIGSAQSATAYGVGYGTFFAYEAIAVDDTSGGVKLTVATFSDANVAFCTLESAEVRYRLDGGAPTTTVGHPLEPLQGLTLMGTQLKTFRAIKTGATNGSLKCSYGK